MPSQPMSINVVKTSNPKGNQESDGKKKVWGKEKNQDRKGNTNKPGKYVGGGRKESKKKVKFPCKLCNADHLTHIFPKIQDSQCLLVQQGSCSYQFVLTNPFPQVQQLLDGTNSSTGTPAWGNQEGDYTPNVYMMSSHIDITT